MRWSTRMQGLVAGMSVLAGMIGCGEAGSSGAGPSGAGSSGAGSSGAGSSDASSSVAASGGSGSGASAAGSAGNGAGSSAAGSGPGSAATVAVQQVMKKRYVFGFVPKSSSNPVFIAARAGAEAAQREIAERAGVEIEIRWTAPLNEDSARQRELIDELTAARVDGLAVSVSDPIVVGPAIDRAAAAGVAVVTFDADAAGSSRFFYYGVNDVAAGRTVAEELASILKGKGRIAVLAGNRSASNIRDRVIGMVEVTRRHPEIEIVGVFDHMETPEAAAAAMTHAHEDHAPIDGWALLGGWPLYIPTGLDGVPAGVPIVSMDPLPSALDFAEAGRVSLLVAQPYYEWGRRSVEALYQALHDGKRPPRAVEAADLELVGPDGVAAYRARWRGWVGDLPSTGTNGGAAGGPLNQ